MYSVLGANLWLEHKNRKEQLTKIGRCWQMHHNHSSQVDDHKWTSGEVFELKVTFTDLVHLGVWKEKGTRASRISLLWGFSFRL